MKKERKPKGYWTFERCQEEALKYENKSLFNEKSKGSYLAARKNGWLDKICSHMVKKGNHKTRCIYAYEFDDNHVYVGLTYNIDNRHSRHIKSEKSAVYIHHNTHNVNYNLKQLTDYIEVNGAIKNEESYLNEYINNGWVILNRVKTGSIGGNKIKWTKENCHKEAQKYNSRKEFSGNSLGAYLRARRDGWLDDACSHMKPKQHQTKWDTDMENKLIELYKNHTRQECADILNISKNAISSRVIKLGLTDSEYKLNKDEINFIKNNFEKIGAIGCANELGRRVDNIRQVAHRFKLKSPSRWSDDELSILKQYYKNDKEYCFRNLNKTRKSIIGKASQLKLSKSTITPTISDNNKNIK